MSELAKTKIDHLPVAGDGPYPARNRMRGLALGTLLLLALVLAACSQPPAPTPTAVPPTAVAPANTALPLTPRATVAPTATASPLAPAPAPTAVMTIAHATRIVIPALQLDAPVVDVGWHVVTGTNGVRTTAWDIADNAAGHHINSAAPGGAGNVVISGHNNIKGKVFQAISVDYGKASAALLPGSPIELYTDTNQKYVYMVDKIERLAEFNAPLAERLANAQVLAPTQDARLTLITCWPPDGTTHRIVVIARLEP